MSSFAVQKRLDASCSQRLATRLCCGDVRVVLLPQRSDRMGCSQSKAAPRSDVRETLNERRRRKRSALLGLPAARRAEAAASVVGSTKLSTKGGKGRMRASATSITRPQPSTTSPGEITLHDEPIEQLPSGQMPLIANPLALDGAGGDAGAPLHPLPVFAAVTAPGSPARAVIQLGATTGFQVSRASSMAGSSRSCSVASSQHRGSVAGSARGKREETLAAAKQALASAARNNELRRRAALERRRLKIIELNMSDGKVARLQGWIDASDQGVSSELGRLGSPEDVAAHDARVVRVKEAPAAVPTFAQSIALLWRAMLLRRHPSGAHSDPLEASGGSARSSSSRGSWRRCASVAASGATVDSAYDVSSTMGLQTMDLGSTVLLSHPSTLSRPGFSE
jgi:hypothetical protein